MEKRKEEGGGPPRMMSQTGREQLKPVKKRTEKGKPVVLEGLCMILVLRFYPLCVAVTKLQTNGGNYSKLACICGSDNILCTRKTS
jgi:hypothetical protein